MRVAGVLHVFQFESRQGEDICMALQTHINDIMMRRYSQVRAGARRGVGVCDVAWVRVASRGCMWHGVVRRGVAWVCAQWQGTGMDISGGRWAISHQHRNLCSWLKVLVGRLGWGALGVCNAAQSPPLPCPRHTAPTRVCVLQGYVSYKGMFPTTLQYTCSQAVLCIAAEPA